LALIARLGQFGPDRARKTDVLGQPEDEVDPLASHQLISASRAKPESARKMMRVCGQRHESAPRSRDLLDRTRRGIDVGGPQLRRQQMTAAEDV